jgi:hypothetical protein
VSCNIEDFGYYESRVLLGEKENMTLQKRILRPFFYNSIYIYVPLYRYIDSYLLTPSGVASNFSTFAKYKYIGGGRVAGHNIDNTIST